MNRKKWTIGIALLLLFLLIIPPFWSVYREMRQARLDHVLIEAIKAGDDKKALETLAEGANGEALDIGEPPTFHEVLLHLLDRHSVQKTEKAYPPALLLLYQHAIHTTRLTRNGRGPGPDPVLIRALLDHGARVNDRDAQGASLLLYACRFSNSDTVRLLLQRGADTELADNVGFTPLMIANVELTKVLLEHGANVEAVDRSKVTVLMWADPHPDKVRILLEHGAKVEAKDVDGKTALDYARDNVNSKHPDPRDREIVALLLKYGAK